MKYLSVCSGIEAASCAWHPLGWEPVAFSEIEPFPCAALAHHYPNVPNWGDMTQFKEWPDAEIDVLVGGTPCQSFSVAGLRKGLRDPRGNLALVFLGIADRYRPRWVVWENVPGVLSSHGGRDFGSFVGGLAELGYGVFYRVLDAQYFGVAQRRRRVFVVGCAGGWPRAAAVLLEFQGLRWDPPPSRKAGENVAGTIKGGSGERGWPDPSDGNGGGLTVAGTLDGNCCSAHRGNQANELSFLCADVSTVDARNKVDRGDSQHLDRLVAQTLRSGGDGGVPSSRGENVVVSFSNRGNSTDVPETLRAGCHGALPMVHVPDVSPAIKARDYKGQSSDGTGDGQPLVVIGFNGDQSEKTRSMGEREEQAPTLRSGATALIAMINMQGSKSNAVAQEDGPSYTLNSMHGHDVHAIAFTQNTRDEVRLIGGDGNLVGALGAEEGMKQRNYICARESGQGYWMEDDKAGSIDAQQGESGSRRNSQLAVQVQWASGGGQVENDTAQALRSEAETNYQFLRQHMSVRRLTPVECERLQGFPDGYTDIPWRGKPNSPDGPRYKALGNSMAVPVMRWIGERIRRVEEIAGDPGS